MEALQAAYKGDLHGRPGTQGEAVCLDTCGRRWQSLQLLGHSWRHSGRPQEGRSGMGHIREKLWNNQLHFGISEMLRDPTDSTADLDLCIKQTVSGCQWKKDTEEVWMIDLLYHATIYYKIRKYIQESETAALKYEMVIEKAKAHEHNVLEYKDHQASHREANSPHSYNNPLLTAHALTKGRPSGWNACHYCCKSHEWGNCPCMGRHAINVRVLISSKLFAVPRFQQPRQCPAFTKARNHSCQDMHRLGATVAGAKVEAISIRRRRCQRSHQSRAYEVTFKNSVLSEVTTTSGGERENHGKVSHQKKVLSGLEEEDAYNRFSCFAIHSKMAQSTNTKSKPLEGLYTDTDPGNRSEIITDITIRVPSEAGIMMMEVKVDPGVQPSCIPLHKFKTLFRHLCRDGLPREGLLDNTQNKFQSYNGGDVICYGHLLIDVNDKVTKKYHPIRFYVMNTDMPRILISHAASYWLGLVKVLCDNKAPRIKR